MCVCANICLVHYSKNKEAKNQCVDSSAHTQPIVGIFQESLDFVTFERCVAYESAECESARIKAAYCAAAQCAQRALEVKIVHRNHDKCCVTVKQRAF